MKRSLVQYLICPVCKHESLRLHPFIHHKDDTQEGILLCASCNQWYLIDDYILEILPLNLNIPRRKQFYQKNIHYFKDLHLRESSLSHSDHATLEKIKQSTFFDDFSGHYVLETQTFWRVYYERTLHFFQRTLGRKSFILDIGCGNGLGSASLLQDHTVIGVDISRSMVKNALKRLAAQPHSLSTYLIADAENLPFKKNIFDACIGFGILHHVVHPDTCIGEISRTLKKGGSYYGHENNKTVFRPFFDFLMKIFTLWSEEAGEHQLLSSDELRLLCKRYGLAVDIHTCIFLPPHIFNFLDYSFARKLMDLSDNLFHSFPWLRQQGGTLVFRARKY